MTGSSNMHLVAAVGIVLGTVFLGARAGSTVGGALGSDGAEGSTPMARVAAGADTTESAVDADSDDVTLRDPFQFPTPKRRPVPKPPKVEKPEPTPTLRALLYDTVAPGVRINVGDKRSEWLQKGDAFLGWSVVDITPDSATLTDGKRTVTVRSIQER